MSTATNGDPRFAELMRRRAEKAGAAATTPPTPAPSPATEPAGRRLDDDGKAEIRRLAAEHPGWSASDLADAFEGEHGWRPTYQGIGRCLAEPAPRRATGRRPAAPRPRPAAIDPAAEVEAIAALSRALAPLSAAEVRRVLAWARARFDAEGGAP